MTKEKENVLTIKELEGREVLLRPTGNKVGFGNTKETIQAKIIEVAHTFATVYLCNQEQKFKITGMYLSDSVNGGYLVFANKEEFEDFLFVEDVAEKIVDNYPYKRHYEQLDRETITKIAALLGIQIEN